MSSKKTVVIFSVPLCVLVLANYEKYLDMNDKTEPRGFVLLVTLYY